MTDTEWDRRRELHDVCVKVANGDRLTAVELKLWLDRPRPARLPVSRRGEQGQLTPKGRPPAGAKR